MRTPERRTDNRTLTVAAAVRAYLADREAEGQDVARTRQQMEAHVLPEWGRRRVADLTAPALKAWRDSLAHSPPCVRSSKGTRSAQHANVDLTDPEIKRRRRSTANRIITAFKAALNQAARMHPAECPDPGTWREGLKAFGRVDAARDRWLRPAEVSRLLEACRQDFRRLVAGALYSGCRYGELCRAKVGDYDADNRALRIPVSKSGKPRHIFLHAEAAEFFDALARDRGTDEWLFTRSDPALVRLREALAGLDDWSPSSRRRAIGEVAAAASITAGTLAQRLRQALGPGAASWAQADNHETLRRLDAALAAPWGRGHQVRPMAQACRLAAIEPPISFHGLRHTYGTLSVQQGMALIALAHNLGHADTRMVEKHYGHLANDYMREQVERFAPTLGSKEDGESGRGR